MSIDLELATTFQIAEELKRRKDAFVLLCCKEPKLQQDDTTMEVGLMSYGHPGMLVVLLQQAVNILNGLPPNGEHHHDL